MRLPLRARFPFLLLVLAAPAPLAAQADRAAETFHVGIGLLQRELHDEAAKQFAAFLRAAPDHPLAAEAHYRLACCQLALGDVTAAIPSLEAAIARGGANFKLRPEALYRLAAALHQGGRHADASAAVGKLLASIEEGHYLRAPALFVAGEALRDAGRDEEAAAAFLAAAAADRDADGAYAVPARYQAGFALLRLARHGDAEAAFRAAAEGHPRHAAAQECWYLAGDAAYRGGRYQEALAAFARCTEGDFADDAALGIAWAKLQLGDRAGARKQFQAVADRFADSALGARARLELGRLMQQDGEHDAAARVLAPLLADGTPPELRAEAAEIAGLAASATGDSEEALRRLQASLADAPEAAHARILVAIGGAHAARGEWDAALAAYERAGAAQPDPDLAGEALYGMCLAQHKLGRFAESRALAEKLLRELPEHRLRAHARLAVAENLFAEKDYAGAEAEYARLDGDPTFARDARFKAAWSVYLQGRQADAADRFAALAEAKDEAHAEEALSMLALAALEAGQHERALEAADRYCARYRKGAFLARTERVASRALQASGDLAGAAKRLAAAAAAEGEGERGRQDRLEIAELMFRKSDFAAAAEAYAALSEGDDAVAARALEGAAWCAFELGDDQRALELIDRALQHAALGARLPDALQLRCAALQRAERWADAAATAERFLAECGKDPRAPDVRYALGVALARDGKQAEAQKVLAPLLAEGGGSRPDRTAYELAWACRRLGDEQAALQAFARVVELTRDEELAGEARLHLGEALLAQGDVEAARVALTGVRGKHRARALYRVGFADLERDPKAARATFEQILAERLAGSFADDTRFLLAEAAHRAGDHAAAVQAFADALRRLPDHDRAQVARVRGGEAAVRAGRAGEAVAWLDEFLRRDQDGSDAGKLERARALLWLGQARALRKDWQGAVAAFQEVTALTDTELAAEAQFRLGDARKAGGDLHGAVDAFVKLSILYGHEEWVQRGLFEAASCYRDLGQPDKAERFLAELRQRFPDSPWNDRAARTTSDRRAR